MLRKSSTLLLLALLIPFFASAQEKVAKRNTDDVKQTVMFPVEKNGNTITAIPYVIVDTMGNAFGAGSGDLNPLAYDPWSKTLALVHRGGGTSNRTLGGEIWYNISTDLGVTWTRVVAINGAAPSAQKTARYPSMSIANPTKGDIAATTGIFAWAQLNPGAFGWQGWGADQPLGQADPVFTNFQPVAPDSFSTRTITWASDDAAQPWMFWANGHIDAGGVLTIWRTQDFVTIEKTTFDTTDVPNGLYTLGGFSRNGVQYVGAIGVWESTPSDYPSWMPGYMKSTDGGATWQNFVGPDHRTISTLAAFDVLWDYDPTDGNTVSYQGDMIVDGNGNVHFLVQYADTNVTPINAALVDVYETAPGVWAASIVHEGLNQVVPLAGTGNPGIGQMGPAANIATDADGQVLFVQWAGSPNVTDTVLDAYAKYKSVTGTTWSALMNLTEDTRNNSQIHLAPYLEKASDGSFKAFTYMGYDLTATGPISNESGPTGAYVGVVNFSLTDVNENPAAELKFDLEQNYPNPFNPATSIRYSVNKSEFVTLKVYDMLGKEVATLVNGVQEPGQKLVNFDGSKLSSGMYIYKLSVGNLTSSKKMMLMK